MSDTKGQHEPSMEEILASIRRIIAEDNDGAAEGEAKDKAAAPVEDVLELTEVVEEDAPIVNAPANPADAPTAASAVEQIFALDPEPGVKVAAAAAPPAPPADNRLISQPSAAASVAALSQLVRAPRERNGGDASAAGAAGRTLEDVVLEALRPPLKTWLDENLPGLVERLVKDEIARLVREAQGR